MIKAEHYHFHKDCKYFPECTEELTKNQGHEVIKFTCPVGGTGYYYKGDLHTIKWECGAFEPYQEELNLDLSGGKRGKDEKRGMT